MTGMIRMVRSEFMKLRHTLLLSLHLLIPAAGAGLFLLYYRVSGWNPVGKVQGYLQVTAVAYPFLISMLCPMAAEMEEEAHLQTFYMMAEKKYRALALKWLVLEILSLGAVCLAVCGFGAGYSVVVGENPFPAAVYIKAALIIWGCGGVLYLWHLLLSFQFGKGVSIGFGILEALLPALMLTGLGDGVWQMAPCAWGGRWCEYLLLYSVDVKSWQAVWQGVRGELITCVLIAAFTTGAVFLWFHYFEGRRCQD